MAYSHVPAAVIAALLVTVDQSLGPDLVDLKILKFGTDEVMKRNEGQLHK